MKRSAAMEELAAAIAKAQTELESLAKTRTAEVRPKDTNKAPFSYPYADLGDALAVIRPTFAANGIAITQELVFKEAQVGAITFFMHSSGQWIEFEPTWVPAGGGPQDMGSAMTYARRYSLLAATGVAATGDDDARRAERGARQGQRVARKASDRQLEKLKKEAELAHIGIEALLATAKQEFGVDFLDDLPSQACSTLIDRAMNRSRMLAQRAQQAERAGMALNPETGEITASDGDDDAPGENAEEFEARRRAEKGETDGLFA